VSVNAGVRYLAHFSRTHKLLWDRVMRVCMHAYFYVSMQLLVCICFCLCRSNRDACVGVHATCVDVYDA
jgi:hypothetical protein